MSPSRPWHGPYQVTSVNDPDITVAKVYFPQEKQIMIHQSRVKHCPTNFGFCWYGGNQKAQGKAPKWVQNLLAGSEVIQVDDGDTHEEQLDDTSDVGAPLEEEAEKLSEREPSNSITGSTRMPCTGYSLRNNPHPSKKSIDARN